MSFLTDLAMQTYDEEGEVFPIQYTCLGWEAAAVKFSDNPYILSTSTFVDAVPRLRTSPADICACSRLTSLAQLCAGNFTGTQDQASRLRWTPEASNAKSLQLVAPELRAQAETQPLAYEAHHYGVWLPDFLCAQVLRAKPHYCASAQLLYV
jgi:hypothetical protein